MLAKMLTPNRIALSLGLALSAALAWIVIAQEVEKDVPFVPTPEAVVDEMLNLAKPQKGEILYDLGCGDGRIVCTAAKKYGVKGTGVDIDPERIDDSNKRAKEEGVTDQVKFVKSDLFKMDFKDANVVTLYLLPDVNERLRPQLFKQLKPGSRVVSHAFDMGDWEADKEVTVKPGGQTVYFWVIPAEVEGTWTLSMGGDKKQEATLDLKQEYQKVTGTAKVGGNESKLKDAKLRGTEFTFTLAGPDGKEMKHTAKVDGEKMKGTAGEGKDHEFTGMRKGGAPKKEQKEGKTEEKSE